MLGKRLRLRSIQCRLAQLQNLGQLEFALEPIQRAQQILLLIREVSAQRILRKQPVMPRLNTLEPLRRIVGKARVQLEVLGQLAGLLRLFDQVVLKARVGDIQQRLDHLGICLPTQIGNPVLGDDDIAQVPGNGAVAVLPDEIGTDLPGRLRQLRRIRIERAPSSAWPWATKLYCPPTPLSTRPSSS